MNLTQGDIFAADGPVPLTSQSATVKFSQSSVLAIPFIPVKVTVSITPPKGVDASTFPVYSGFIQLQSGSEQYQVTYLGVAAALKDKQILDNTSEFFGVPLPTILDSTGNVQNGTTNYTFVGDDFPTVLLRYVGFFFVSAIAQRAPVSLAFGTPLLRLDLVDPNIKFTPTFSKRAPTPGGSFTSVPILGSLAEQDFIPRNSDAAVSFSHMARLLLYLLILLR